MDDWASGVSLSRPLEDLRAIVEEWIRLYRVASEHFLQSQNCWYVEQTITGLFSAAAWRCNVPCITEVKASRHTAGGDVPGHADLVLKIGAIRVAVEAKIKWLNNADGFDGVLGMLESAVKDAQSLDARFASRRIAMCFGVFEVGGDSLESLLAVAVSKSRAMPVDLTAWQILMAPPPDVRYPGCIALAREVT